MIIEFKDVTFDIDFNVIKGSGPSLDNLHPGDPDRYELDYLYVICSIDNKSGARSNELWYLLAPAYQQQIIDLWLEKQ